MGYCYKINVYGKVQGVGFRNFVFRLAKTMGVSGYVKNEPDRSVAIVAQMPQDTLPDFIEEVKKGNYHSFVERVEFHDYITSELFSDFQIRY